VTVERYVCQHLSLADIGKTYAGKPRSEPDPGKPAVRERDQEKQVCSMGDRPIEAKVRSLVAWIAGRKGNRISEAYRQSHLSGW